MAYDFRAADVAAGGEGAPFAPVFHHALARRLARPPPVAVLNVGGVANVTYIDGDDPVACDTGPGNALIDDFVRLRTGKPLDTDGQIAQAGSVDQDASRDCSSIRSLPRRRRNRSTATIFAAGWATAFDSRSVEDGAATLTALTAASVARIVPFLPRCRKPGLSPAAAPAIRP